MAESCTDNCCLFIRGDVLWRDVPKCGDSADPAPFEKVGEVRSYTHSLEVTTIGKQKSFGLSGGYTCTAYTFDGLTINMTIQCAKNSNLAVAFFGDNCDTVAGTAETEDFPASMVVGSSILPLKYIGATNVSITSPAGAVLGVDYKLTPAGIEILEGSALIGLDVTVQYDYSIQGRVEIGTKNNVAKEILLNAKDQDGKAIVVRLFNVELAAEGEIELFSEDAFLEFTVTGTALASDDASSTEWCPGLIPSSFGYIQRVA